jgi:response regulator RpfG family c-di-GMP phosphodiesterase
VKLKSEILICIIDDDSINNFLNKMLINQYDSAIQVSEHLDGIYALNWLEKTIRNGGVIPGIILLDINMPIMSGWEFLYELHKKEIPKDLKIHIYILSSSVYPKDIERAKEDPNIKGFLSKPLNSEKIEQVISEYLQVD